MRLTRVGPLSLAKLAAGLYACIGLIMGAIFALAATLGASLGASGDTSPFLGAVFGVGAIVLFPLMYGVLGALGALISALLYNLFAGWLGGIELTLE